MLHWFLVVQKCIASFTEARAWWRQAESRGITEHQGGLEINLKVQERKKQPGVSKMDSLLQNKMWLIILHVGFIANPYWVSSLQDPKHNHTLLRASYRDRKMCLLLLCALAECFRYSVMTVPSSGNGAVIQKTLWVLWRRVIKEVGRPSAGERL